MRELKLGRSGKVAIVDADFELPPGSLVLSTHGYPKLMRSTGVRRASGSYVYEEIYLHHLVAGKPGKGMEIDHRDGNKLDARRANLRVCSRMENAQNVSGKKVSSSRFRGVHRTRKNPASGKVWVAQITCDHRVKCLGNFTTEEEAAAAYNTAAAELHKDYARLNVLTGNSHK